MADSCSVITQESVLGIKIDVNDKELQDAKKTIQEMNNKVVTIETNIIVNDKTNRAFKLSDSSSEDALLVPLVPC